DEPAFHVLRVDVGRKRFDDGAQQAALTAQRLLEIEPALCCEGAAFFGGEQSIDGRCVRVGRLRCGAVGQSGSFHTAGIAGVLAGLRVIQGKPLAAAAPGTASRPRREGGPPIQDATLFPLRGTSRRSMRSVYAT